MEDLSGRRVKDISKPLKNSFIHTGHGSHRGKTWGNPENIDEVYLRNPMSPSEQTGVESSPEKNNTRLLGRSSMRSSKGVEAMGQNKQFKYGRLGDEASPVRQDREDNPPSQREEGGGHAGHVHPHRPAPGWGGARPLSYKSMPDLQTEVAHTREDSLIDLTVSPGEGRLYSNSGMTGAVSTSSLLDQSFGEMEENSFNTTAQTYQNNDSFQDDFNDTMVSRSSNASYMNQIEMESEEVISRHTGRSSTPGHDSSFNSLPPGETYHLPPDDEDDPFDTSNVIINNLSTSRGSSQLNTSHGSGRFYSANLDTQAPSMTADQQTTIINSLNTLTMPPSSNPMDGTSGPPSIISQLLASHPSTASNSPQPLPTPPPTRRETVQANKDRFSEPRYGIPSPQRHRRAMSTMSEAETFLPPLGSPFSPPAFNPYDIILGSNEAIAGLDSPAPNSGELGRHKVDLSRDQAFSWLEDKMDDLKVGNKTQSSQDLGLMQQQVFQFPSVSQPGVQDGRLEEERRKEEEERRRQEDEENRRKEEERKSQEEMYRQQETLRKQYQQQQILKEQEYLRQQKAMQEQQQMQMLKEQQQKQQVLLQQQMVRQQKEKELERKNLQKIMKHRQEQQDAAASALSKSHLAAGVPSQGGAGGGGHAVHSSQSSDVFHFPQVSTLSTAGETLPTYTIDKNFLKDLEKNLGANDALANMLGPHPPPTPSAKVANIPLLQPPPPSNRATRTSPTQPPQSAGARQRTSPRQDTVQAVRPGSSNSGGRPGSSSSITRPTSRGSSSLRTPSSSGARPPSAGGVRPPSVAGSETTPDKNRTAHVRPFQHNEGGRMGDVMGASSGWRSINTASGQQGGRVDLLAGQRTQLGRYTEGTTDPGQEREQEMYGSRSAGRSSNAMEINKIAQCSKMVPGMSGSEIRSVLEAVNWDTSIAVKNLKIDKLYRIGVATKPKCEKVLQAVSWDLEQAASRLLDSL